VLKKATEQPHTKPFRDIRLARRRVNPLRDFTGHVIRDIVHAVTGKASTWPALTERARAAGLPAEEFEEALSAGESDADIATGLLTIARSHYGKGAYWLDLSVKTQARDHYLLAMLWCVFAELFIEEPFLRARVHPLYQEGYRRASEVFAHPAREVCVGYGALTLRGYLRLPDGAPRAIASRPCAILLNGLSSTKEELYYTENALLAADIATLSFDYPGVCEDTSQALMALDVDGLAYSLCALLAAQREIDITRVALYGVSFGARLALHFAALMPERFKAVVAISAPFDMLQDVETLHATLEQEAAIYPATTVSALSQFGRKTSLITRLNRLQAPLLVAGGGRDLIALPEETSFIYESAACADKKLILCPSAGHVCSEMMPSLRHEIAQWIKQRV
jgi:2,6-dihydroxypseudooxynicotine hydrolase